MLTNDSGSYTQRVPGVQGSGCERPACAAGPPSCGTTPSDASGVGRQASESDNELLVRLKAGDTGALAEIYERHAALLRREIASCGVWPSDRADVLQEILLNLSRRLASWHPAKCSAVRCLKSIARAVAIEWVRRAQLDIDRFSELDQEPPARESRPDLSGDVAALLSRLPDKQRQAVELVYLEEMTHVQAAEIMGVSVRASEMLVHRAIVFLRETQAGGSRPC